MKTTFFIRIVSVALFLWAVHLQARPVDELIDRAGVSGGLIVVLGVDSPERLMEWRKTDAFVVHGLDTDPQKVKAAREAIRKAGLYGPVSVDLLRGDKLPYVDDLVNVLLVTSDECRVSDEEIERVLAPSGVSVIINQPSAISHPVVKPRPSGLDDWPHFLYGPDNNAVSEDRVVGPPKTLRWIDGPRWARQHDHAPSMQAMVSAGGRVFHIMDEGPLLSIGLNPDWQLTARDAFNGLVLWKRPIDDWFTSRWSNKNGPISLPRRLVADDESVYVTLGLTAAVSRLDGATGEMRHTYKGTENAEEIILADHVLYLVKGTTLADLNNRLSATNHYLYLEGAARRGTWGVDPKTVSAVDADSGRILWTHQAAVAPVTLAVSGGQVFFSDWEKVVALSATTGEVLWESKSLEHHMPMKTGISPTLVVREHTVLFAGMDGAMTALDAKDGRRLWQSEHPGAGYATSGDVLVHKGLAWTDDTVKGGKPGTIVGRDLRTGEIQSQFDADVDIYWFHHRCYRNKATADYLVLGRTGIEYVDVEKEHWDVNHWTRGGCMYGVMPANGLTYTAPHPCACFLGAKMSGFTALGGRLDDPKKLPDPSASRREKGAGANRIQNSGFRIQNEDWPTYRGDNARSGFSKTTAPTKVKEQWAAPVGENLTALTVAAGKVFVADRDAHTLHALDADTGKSIWSFMAGGRIDSPPTIVEVSNQKPEVPADALCLFGSRDGWIYALNADDGALVWRFRAAPADRRMTAFGQVESVWPTHGSVLVQDGVLYTVAGRSMFLDGGLRFIKLDPVTGDLLSEVIWDETDPDTGGNLHDKVNLCNMPVALSDILSYDGKYLYMREQALNLNGKRVNVQVGNVKMQVGDETHLFAPAGFLEDTWFHRIFWIYGQNHFAIGGAHASAARHAPAGRLMVHNDDTVFSFGTQPQYHFWTTPLEYHLFACPRDFKPTQSMWPDQRMSKEGPKMKRKEAPHPEFNWHRELPILARGMVISSNTLFVAGPADVMDENKVYAHLNAPESRKAVIEQQAAWEGQRGAVLYAVDPATGEELTRMELDSPPAWDGLAAARGKLYISTMDGRVVCLGE